MVNIDSIRHLYPFQSRYMDLNGHRCHYVDEGRGRPVVMVHGNPTWSFYFRDLIRMLGAENRAIAMDHIGCGLSEKTTTTMYDFRLKSRVNDFTSFMDQLNLDDDITLVIHDWGGMIAMAWAVFYPERIRKIVVMNTAAFPMPKGKKLPAALNLIRKFSVFAVPAVLGLNLFSLGTRFFASERGLSPDVRKGYALPYHRPRTRLAILKFVQDIPVSPSDPGADIVRQTADRLEYLSRIPMMIFWGEKDFVFDMDYLQEWQRRFPQARTHLYPNAGHLVLEDAAQEIIPRLREFLDNPLTE